MSDAIQINNDMIVNPNINQLQQKAKREQITKYDTLVKPRFDEIFNWLRTGATRYSIAEKLGIHYNTFTRMEHEYVEFGELIKNALTSSCEIIYHNQFKKACGFLQPVKKVKILNTGEQIEYYEEQYIPPSEASAEMISRNRDSNFKQARQDNNINLIQQNFQLPQAKAELLQIEEELKKLELLEAVSVEPIE